MVGSEAPRRESLLGMGTLLGNSTLSENWGKKVAFINFCLYVTGSFVRGRF